MISQSQATSHQSLDTVPVLFIVGPTGIGKTRLSIELAKRLNGEIVSADSMQVYKGMTILSQAPTAAQRRQARHHLVAILDPGLEYSAAIFRRKATALVGSILKKGRVPIITGGSGLYVKALIDGLFPSPPADPAFRKKMQDYAGRYGSPKLHAKLAAIDPASAATIHPNDVRRMIRALEIYHATGKTMTELKATTRGLKDGHDIRVFGLTAPRESLYAATDARVDRMVRAGLVAEAKRLARKRLSKTATAALGYKEMAGYLSGSYDLAQAVSLLKMNTRRFVKRQLTWFRADKRVQWFDVERLGDGAVLRKIVGEITQNGTRASCNGRSRR